MTFGSFPSSLAPFISYYIPNFLLAESLARWLTHQQQIERVPHGSLRQDEAGPAVAQDAGNRDDRL